MCPLVPKVKIETAEPCSLCTYRFLRWIPDQNQTARDGNYNMTQCGQISSYCLIYITESLYRNKFSYSSHHYYYYILILKTIMCTPQNASMM